VFLLRPALALVLCSRRFLTFLLYSRPAPVLPEGSVSLLSNPRSQKHPTTIPFLSKGHVPSIDVFSLADNGYFARIFVMLDAASSTTGYFFFSLNGGKRVRFSPPISLLVAMCRTKLRQAFLRREAVLPLFRPYFCYKIPANPLYSFYCLVLVSLFFPCPCTYAVARITRPSRRSVVTESTAEWLPHVRSPQILSGHSSGTRKVNLKTGQVHAEGLPFFTLSPPPNFSPNTHNLETLGNPRSWNAPKPFGRPPAKHPLPFPR